MKRFHHRVGDFHASPIFLCDQGGRDLQSSLCSGFTDVLCRELKRAQRATGPGFANLAEEPLFDRVPFGGAGWRMADGQGQAKAVGHFVLQLLFPHSGSGPVASAAVGFDQQLGGVWETFQTFGCTPLGDVIHGKGRRICRAPQIDRAAIVGEIINAIRHRPPERILLEVMDVHGRGALAPDLTGVPEVAN